MNLVGQIQFGNLSTEVYLDIFRYLSIADIAVGDYDPWIESIIIGINRDEGTFFNHRSQVRLLLYFHNVNADVGLVLDS